MSTLQSCWEICISSCRANTYQAFAHFHEDVDCSDSRALLDRLRRPLLNPAKSFQHRGARGTHELQKGRDTVTEVQDRGPSCLLVLEVRLDPRAPPCAPVIQSFQEARKTSQRSRKRLGSGRPTQPDIVDTPTLVLSRGLLGRESNGDGAAGVIERQAEPVGTVTKVVGILVITERALP